MASRPMPFDDGAGGCGIAEADADGAPQQVGGGADEQDARRREQQRDDRMEHGEQADDDPHGGDSVGAARAITSRKPRPNRSALATPMP